MATVKISVKALASEKAVFSSAAGNIREVIETLNNAQRSIGNDRMFDEARRSLSKLSELLEKRARALEALSDALGSASESYGNAQAQGVRVVSGFRAHKTDFYGNPVHVSAASGAAAVGTAYNTAPAASAEPLVYSSDNPQSSSAAPGGNTVIENLADNHVENNYVYNNYANEAPAAVPSQDTSGAPSASSAAPYTAETLSASSAYHEAAGAVPLSSDASPSFTQDIHSETAQVPFSSTSEVQNGDMTAAVITGGIAGAAALAGAAVGLSSEKIKQDKEKRKIEDQIKEAKKKLRQIEDEQFEIASAASETDTE